MWGFFVFFPLCVGRKSPWTRVLLFSEASGVSCWCFNPRLACSVPLATCHIIRMALITAIVGNAHWNSDSAACVFVRSDWRQCQPCASSFIRAAGCSYTEAVQCTSWAPSKDSLIIRIIIINAAWWIRKSSRTPLSTIPRGLEANEVVARRRCKRATAQISRADADEPMPDQWLWVFCPAEPPETAPPGAFITHRNVWLMESEKRSPPISIRWPRAHRHDWSRLLFVTTRWRSDYKASISS